MRIRVQKKQPDEQEDEEGNIFTPEVDEAELEELPIDDKCLSLATAIGSQSVYVLNQAAGRYVRQELARELISSVPALQTVDLSEFFEKMEPEAERIESSFCDLFGKQSEAACPKVPVFDFKPTIN